jgi:hypothetical protein
MAAFLPSKRAAKANAESRAERKKRLDRERHARNRSKQTLGQRAKRFEDMWKEREAKALNVVRSLKTNVHVSDVCKALEVKQSVAGDVMRRLVGKGFVTATGGVGRWRRYNIPD